VRPEVLLDAHQPRGGGLERRHRREAPRPPPPPRPSPTPP
jgi:hypothetical protein